MGEVEDYKNKKEKKTATFYCEVDLWEDFTLSTRCVGDKPSEILSDFIREYTAQHADIVTAEKRKVTAIEMVNAGDVDEETLEKIAKLLGHK